MKKLVSFMLVCAILILSGPIEAYATPAFLTIEEILNEYHQKAFKRETTTNAVASYSLHGETKTLEQETIDSLSSAGYEAFNVTKENYKTVEADLKTDFASMDLDPTASYIVVVSGEEASRPSATGITTNDVNPLPGWDEAPEGGLSDSYFYYTYEGKSYFMRYITVTEADAPGNFFVKSSHTLENISYFEDVADVLADYTLSLTAERLIDGVGEGVPYVGVICSIASLLGDLYDVAIQSPANPLDPGTLVLRAGTAWTRSYIQVYNEVDQYWYTTQCSSYAITEVSFDAEYVYNAETNSPMKVGGILDQYTTYSPYYEKTELRKIRAVGAFLNGNPLFDHTGDIEFYIKNPNNSNPQARSIFLFVHKQNVTYRYPSKE